jgi:hypothetical protein
MQKKLSDKTTQLRVYEKWTQRCLHNKKGGQEEP